MAARANDKKKTGKVWMHSLELVDRTLAAELFMPYIKGGGVFVETTQKLELGDSLFVLPDDNFMAAI